MSTKIYNAYVLDKNYSMYELEQLLKPVKENIKKMAIDMKKRWLMSKYFYYCDYLKVHGKEKCKERADKIKVEDELSECKKQIWEDLANESLQYLDLHIDWYFSERLQFCKRPSLCNNYKALVQVIPLADKTLAMYFGNPDFFQECNFSFLSDYHYQNQCDKPEDISDEEWDKRKNDWDKAIGPDYIPAKYGFTVELFNKEWDFGITNFKKIEKEFYPTMEQRIKRIIETFDEPDCPKDVSQYLNYIESEQHKNWVKEKSKEVEAMLEPADTVMTKN